MSFLNLPLSFRLYNFLISQIFFNYLNYKLKNIFKTSPKPTSPPPQNPKHTQRRHNFSNNEESSFGAKFCAKKVPLSGHYSLDLGQIRKEISRKSNFLQLREGSSSQKHNQVSYKTTNKNTLLWPLTLLWNIFFSKTSRESSVGEDDAIPFRW
jgi:hypothetical protein